MKLEVDDVLPEFPTLTVERSLPAATIQGLATGKYVLNGGVIRHAPGSGLGGQVVRHLMFPTQPESSATAQLIAPVLSQVLGSSAEVLQAANMAMAVSGLNLAVSAVGFAALYRKMSILERRIDQIAADVRAVRDAQERRERAELQAALDHLMKAERMEDGEARREVVGRAHQALGVKKRQFADLFEHVATPESLAVCEESYCVASLAHARCYGELGSADVALDQLEEDVAAWSGMTRRAASEVLIGSAPERFLFAEFAEDVPLSSLASWLDFTGDEARGIRQLDDLRAKLGSYYDEDGTSLPDIDDLRHVPGGLGRRLSGVKNWRSRVSDTELLQRDREVVVPAMHRFVSRGPVLDGYVDQYRLMADYDVKPSELDRAIAGVPAERCVDGFMILTLPSGAREVAVLDA